ncbi:hypothetical protein QV65_15045, partial [Rhodococcus erythropolis]
FDGGSGARRLVFGGQTPARGTAGGDGDQGVGDEAGLLGSVVLVLAVDGVGVRAVLGDGREPVVQVLGGVTITRALGSTRRSARKRGLGSAPSPIGWWPMCSTPPAITTSYWPKPMPDAVVVTAVIAPAHMRRWRIRERFRGDRRGSQRCGRWSGPGHRSAWWLRQHFVDPCGIELRVTAKQLTNRLYDEIVCARVGVHAFRAGLAERGANAVDEDDVALVVCGWSHANSS